MSCRTYQGAPVHVVWARRAGRITLKRTACGKWALTLPQGVPAEVGLQYLEGYVPGTGTPFSARYLPGERHLVLGVRVTLGREGVPCGETFLRWRQARLEALLEELTARWLPRLNAEGTSVAAVPLKGLWGRCLFSQGAIELNADCAMLQPPQVEELLVHELCHLTHRDHSPAFWQLMTDLLPAWPRLEGELRSADLSPLPEEKQ